MANEEESAEDRRELVRLTVRALEKRGYSHLLADLPEQHRDERPYSVVWEGGEERFRPDIIARGKDRDFLFEVETAETFGSPLTEEKIEIFSAFAAHNGQFFCLVVPAEFKEKAREKLQSLDVDERFSYVAGF
ncbi:MAG TPA: hypothetical protein VJ882_03080 [Desulfuromonadales bacterium]|nr:hypothetical protein [Desulfuromonadales bacterium]